MFKFILNIKEFFYFNENIVKLLVNLVNNLFGVFILFYYNFYILEDDNVILVIEIYVLYIYNIEFMIFFFIYFKFIFIFL